jgi:hypothetical protein
MGIASPVVMIYGLGQDGPVRSNRVTKDVLLSTEADIDNSF